MLMSIIPDTDYLKLDSSRLMRLLLSASFAVRHQLYPQWALALKSHMSSRKHSNAAAQSSSASKGHMQLTYGKYWNAMEKLWKSYGIFFLGICTNPV